MDGFINLIKRDPKVQIKIKDNLHNCIKIPIIQIIINQK